KQKMKDKKEGVQVEYVTSRLIVLTCTAQTSERNFVESLLVAAQQIQTAHNKHTKVVGDNAKTDPKRMGRGMDPYMIRYRSTRPRGGSVDCFGVGRRGSTPAWNIYGGLVDPWENGNISDLICFHVSLVEGVWNFLDVMENESAFI
uniref:Uncharacterized protein n=3 Tax=Caenorhabditis japonica TaxID=281687 RepID=A0A8R1ELX9_CAEJA